MVAHTEIVGDIVKREPRDWRKDGHNYAIHIIQGGIIFYLLPWHMSLTFLALGYIIYQIVEYKRARDLRESEMKGWVRVGDWISRDIADWLVGGWVGMIGQSPLPGALWHLLISLPLNWPF